MTAVESTSRFRPPVGTVLRPKPSFPSADQFASTYTVLEADWVSEDLVPVRVDRADGTISMSTIRLSRIHRGDFIVIEPERVLTAADLTPAEALFELRVILTELNLSSLRPTESKERIGTLLSVIENALDDHHTHHHEPVSYPAAGDFYGSELQDHMLYLNRLHERLHHAAELTDEECLLICTEERKKLLDLGYSPNSYVNYPIEAYENPVTKLKWLIGQWVDSLEKIPTPQGVSSGLNYSLAEYAKLAYKHRDIIRA